MKAIARIERVLRDARREGRAALREPAAKEVLAALDIPVPASIVVPPSQEASDLLSTLRPPFVLKVVSPDVLHKSDVGGVQLGLHTAEDVDACIRRLRDHFARQHIHVEGWLVEETAPSGLEIVIGGVRDPEFGPMVMVGLGGVFIEVLADVAFRICPVSDDDCREMLAELRGAPLLSGARGRAPACVDAIVDALLKLGGGDGLMTRFADDIAELDVNPLIVTDRSIVAVDARILLDMKGQSCPEIAAFDARERTT